MVSFRPVLFHVKLLQADAVVSICVPLAIMISIVTVAAHDTDGVNVYCVVPVTDVFIVEGVQKPGTPLLDVDGNVGGVEFLHRGPTCVNAGVTLAVITIFIITVAAQDNGVKVYAVVPTTVVLIIDGLQVPAIPSFESRGSSGAVDPWHKGPIWVNVGVTEEEVFIIKWRATVSGHPLDPEIIFRYTPEAE